MKRLLSIFNAISLYFFGEPVFSRRDMNALADDTAAAVRSLYKEREKALIESHRKCHNQYELLLERGSVLSQECFNALEKYAEEIRAKDRTVEADRIMEIADKMLWALDDETRKRRADKHPIPEAEYAH